MNNNHCCVRRRWNPYSADCHSYSLQTADKLLLLKNIKLVEYYNIPTNTKLCIIVRKRIELDGFSPLRKR